MSRYFIKKELIAPEDIDLDSSDMHVLVAIHSDAPGKYEVVRIIFDFCREIVPPHRVNNRIVTDTFEKDRVEGFVKNILGLGRRCREVHKAEYQSFHQRLMDKSAHMAKKKRRKLVVETRQHPAKTRLP